MSKELEAVLALVPAAAAAAARGAPGPSPTAVADDAALSQIAGALVTLAATPAGNTQSAIVDILSKAGFGESSAALARAASATAIAADVSTAAAILVVTALSTVVQQRGGVAAGGAAAAASSKGSAPLSDVQREELRSAIAGRVEAALGHVKRHFRPEEASRLLALVSSLSAAPASVQRVTKQSVVVGDTAAILACPDRGVVVEDCDSATVMVTAAVPRITIRRCRSCTIAAVPASATVSIEDCSGCSFTLAAPLVSVHASSDCTLFVWAHAPVAVSAGSAASAAAGGSPAGPIAIGPYNAVGDGLMEVEGFKRWYVRGDSRFDAHGSAAGSHSLCRAILPAEFYWRYLPLPQANREHIVMPLAFSMAASAPPPAPVLAEAASLRGPAAQRAEIKVQSAFVAWMLEEGKVLPLKNAFR